MRAGCARNQTQSANTILVTPIAEPGILELYNAKKTIHYRNFEYKDQSIQISQYELRWKPISKESEIQNIVFMFFIWCCLFCRIYLLLMNMNLLEYVIIVKYIIYSIVKYKME